MKSDIDEMLEAFFQSEERAACRILGRRMAVARVLAWRRDRGVEENGHNETSLRPHERHSGNGEGM
jgi:hypothetical protein